jgi:hypothetical protein
MKDPKNPRIVFRKWGKAPRKHDVMFKYLTDEHIKFLCDNEHIKFLKKDHQLFSIILKISFMERMMKSSKLFVPNPYNGSITSHKELLKDSAMVDWDCAICRTPIRSKMDDFSIQNFCCADCQKVHDAKSKRVDVRIKDHSVKFTAYCRELLKGQQNEFFSYLKRNIKEKEQSRDQFSENI